MAEKVVAAEAEGGHFLAEEGSGRLAVGQVEAEGKEGHEESRGSAEGHCLLASSCTSRTAGLTGFAAVAWCSLTENAEGAGWCSSVS